MPAHSMLKEFEKPMRFCGMNIYFECISFFKWTIIHMILYFVTKLMVFFLTFVVPFCCVTRKSLLYIPQSLDDLFRDIASIHFSRHHFFCLHVYIFARFLTKGLLGTHTILGKCLFRQDKTDYSKYIFRQNTKFEIEKTSWNQKITTNNLNFLWKVNQPKVSAWSSLSNQLRSFTCSDTIVTS